MENTFPRLGIQDSTEQPGDIPLFKMARRATSTLLFNTISAGVGDEKSLLLVQQNVCVKTVSASALAGSTALQPRPRMSEE